ncbi:MAG: hypothetical protein KDC46_15645 [Thermoleophilia bacterium]|nr:hypothetical protein [Thermoleophilia bacterium]
MLRQDTYLDPSEAGGHRWVFNDVLDPLPAPDQRGADPEREITGAEAVADLDALESLLVERHIGCEIDPSIRAGVRETIEDHRSKTVGRERLTVAALCVDLGRELAELFLDGHLKPRLARSPISANADSGPAIEIEQIDDVSIVRVRRLWYTEQADRERLEAFATWTVPDETTTVVFDFRGCPGGDDSFICNWIERSIIDDVPIGSLVRRTGPGRLIDESNQLTAAAAMIGRHEARRLAAAHPDHFTMIDVSRGVGEQLTALSGDATGVDEVPLSLIGRGPRRIAAKAVALIDRGTGSSAESSTIALRQALGATVIGTPSAGCVDWGNVINYPLPGTGTSWCLPTHTTRGAGGPYDLRGITPDILLDVANVPAIDALRAAEAQLVVDE